MPKNGERRIRIYQDEDPTSPLNDDNLGTMATWHRRYALGHEQPKETPEEWLAEHSEEEYLILPLYLYDHSGITISCSPFSCPWDSGRLGNIYVSHQKIKAEYGALTEGTLERARDVLLSEVATYDQYLKGDIWAYVIEEYVSCSECGRGEWETLDSCGGFYGHHPEENDMKDNWAPEYKDLPIEHTAY